MTLEIWIAFTLASAAMLAIPGPTVLLVVSYALGYGRRSALATVPGVTLGDFTAMSISLAGAGAVLATSASLFTALKLFGAAYLIWLGLRLWRTSPRPLALPGGSHVPGDLRRMFWNSYVVTALNPKSIVFFVAFVPQFMDPAAPLLPQVVLLEVTFLTLAAVNIALWAVMVGGMRARFRRVEALRLINRVGGGFLMGAGALTALMRRAA
ncbi:LysE family translocator [Limibaculum sp. M0105]|uniref:LysE family translocator n=1 Tax=Thermohalobaculum xanthum TaxID=2753746 RepID=A0A8J7MBA7_9RHOB|nr:LysE family translocator [Thermohalobaculum xanthum]MBK0400989.1 LysE family translocator [Thermohalobaculum xanthum]